MGDYLVLIWDSEMGGLFWRGVQGEGPGKGLDKALALDRNSGGRSRGARRACLALQATGSLDRIQKGAGVDVSAGSQQL